MKKNASLENHTVVASSAVSPATVTAPVSTAAPVSPTPLPVVATMTDPAVQECAALLDQVVSMLGDQDPMSGDQVRRSTKMRKGGGGVIPKIIALCEQHGVTKIGSLTIEEMKSQLDRGDALVQVGLRTSLVQKKVKEGAMAAHGRSWQIGTTMYTTLQRLAVDDPELALGLAPIQSFFQTKTTKGKVRANKKASAAKKAAANAEGATAVSAESTPAAPAQAAVPPAAAEAAPTAVTHASTVATPAPVTAGGAAAAPVIASGAS